MTRKFRFQYPHSKFWLVFWLILGLPVGIALACKNTELVSAGRLMKIEYAGSWPWVFFWAFFCFPVAALLLLLNGSVLVRNDFIEIT